MEKLQLLEKIRRYTESANTRKVNIPENSYTRKFINPKFHIRESSYIVPEISTYPEVHKFES